MFAIITRHIRNNFLAVVTPIKEVRVLQRSFIRLVGLLTLQ